MASSGRPLQRSSRAQLGVVGGALTQLEGAAAPRTVRDLRMSSTQYGRGRQTRASTGRSTSGSAGAAIRLCCRSCRVAQAGGADDLRRMPRPSASTNRRSMSAASWALVAAWRRATGARSCADSSAQNHRAARRRGLSLDEGANPGTVVQPGFPVATRERVRGFRSHRSWRPAVVWANRRTDKSVSCRPTRAGSVAALALTVSRSPPARIEWVIGTCSALIDLRRGPPRAAATRTHGEQPAGRHGHATPRHGEQLPCPAAESTGANPREMAVVHTEIFVIPSGLSYSRRRRGGHPGAKGRSLDVVTTRSAGISRKQPQCPRLLTGHGAARPARWYPVQARGQTAAWNGLHDPAHGLTIGG